jgi:hypothetical protein
MALLLPLAQLLPTPASARMGFYINKTPSEFPTRLQNNLSSQPDWVKGFLDVTKAPYSAAGDGVNDDTEEIQKAIDDAYESNLIVFFPSGTYLVSGQLRMISGPVTATNDEGHTITITSPRKYGHLLVGSTTGPRPVIKLKDNSFGNATLLLFQYLEGATEHPPRMYLATIRGINIDMGSNPDSTALSMNGAQYSSIEDINISGNFDIGIKDLPGAGGNVVNVKITGGNVGILQKEYRPNPTLAGIELLDQRDYGIKLLRTRGPLTVVGFDIKSRNSPIAGYRAIYLKYDDTNQERINSQADLNLVDGSIYVKGAGGVAIENWNQNVVMNNVYVRADSVIKSGYLNGAVENVNGNNSLYMKITQYYFASGSDHGFVHIASVGGGAPCECANRTTDFQGYIDLTNEDPPADLISRHIWGSMPSWEDSGLINIASYGATADDPSDDDVPAIQQAIDETTDPLHANYGKTVFIPRGHFHVAGTIMLKAGTKLIGAGKGISAIQASRDWRVTQPTVIVDTVDDANANIQLSDFAIIGNYPSVYGGLTDHKYLTLFRLRGGNTTMRDVQVDLRETVTYNAQGEDVKKDDSVIQEPWVVFTGHAGGKVYDLNLDHPTWANGVGGSVASSFRQMLIDGTTSGLNLYQIAIAAESQIPVGAWRSEIKNSQNVKIFGFKYEDGLPLLKISDSSHIKIIGGSGIYGTRRAGDDTIIRLVNSSDVMIANLARSSHPDDITSGKKWIINGNDNISDNAPVVFYVTEGYCREKP